MLVLLLAASSTVLAVAANKKKSPRCRVKDECRMCSTTDKEKIPECTATGKVILFTCREFGEGDDSEGGGGAGGECL